MFEYYKEMELMNDPRKEMKEYLKKFNDLTAKEKKELREWVADGYSVRDNPYCISGEDGLTMDFINAYRMNADMYEDYLRRKKSGELEINEDNLRIIEGPVCEWF